MEQKTSGLTAPSWAPEWGWGVGRGSNTHLRWLALGQPPASTERGTTGMGTGSNSNNTGSFLGSLFGGKRSKAPGPIIPPGPPYPAPVAPPTTGGPPPLSPSSLCPGDAGGPSKIQALHAQYCHTTSNSVSGQPPPPYYHHHRFHTQTVPSSGQQQQGLHTLQRVTLPRRPHPNPSVHSPYQPISQHTLQGRYGSMGNMGSGLPPPLSPHSPLSPHPQFALFHTQPTHSARGGPISKPPLTLSHSQPHPHAHSHPAHMHTPHPGSHPVHQPHFVFTSPPPPPFPAPTQPPPVSTSGTVHHALPAAQYLPQYPPLSSIPPPPLHSPLPPPSSPLIPLTPLSPLPPQHQGPLSQPGGQLGPSPAQTGAVPGGTGTVERAKSKPTNRISTVVWAGGSREAGGRWRVLWWLEGGPPRGWRMRVEAGPKAITTPVGKRNAAC